MDAHWKMITDFMPLEEFQQTELHRLALKPIGVNHQLFGMLGLFEGNAYAISLNRTHNEYSERDREVLNTVHPHLVTSFFNALAFGRAKDSISHLQAAMESAPGAYAYFDKHGELGWMQARAESWLKEFFPAEVLVNENVPVTVRQMVHRSLQNQNAPQSLEKESATERLVICLGSSVLGGFVLRLERKAIAKVPHFRPLPQLSARENDVMKWMVEGKRNSEIATILNLSTRTVENHVQGILRHLMVENRATAIVRAMEFCAAATLSVYREFFWPHRKTIISATKESLKLRHQLWRHDFRLNRVNARIRKFEQREGVKLTEIRQLEQSVSEIVRVTDPAFLSAERVRWEIEYRNLDENALRQELGSVQAEMSRTNQSSPYFAGLVVRAGVIRLNIQRRAIAGGAGANYDSDARAHENLQSITGELRQRINTLQQQAQEAYSSLRQLKRQRLFVQ